MINVVPAMLFRSLQRQFRCVSLLATIHLSTTICKSVQGRLCLGVFIPPPSYHSAQQYVERLNAHMLPTKLSSIWHGKASRRVWCLGPWRALRCLAIYSIEASNSLSSRPFFPSVRFSRFAPFRGISSAVLYQKTCYPFLIGTITSRCFLYS